MHKSARLHGCNSMTLLMAINGRAQRKCRHSDVLNAQENLEILRLGRHVRMCITIDMIRMTSSVQW